MSRESTFSRSAKILSKPLSPTNPDSTDEVNAEIADGNAKILGDALGEVSRDVDLPRGRVVAVLEDRNRRQRHLVGNARIVGRECRGKESAADEAMGKRVGSAEPNHAGDSDALQRQAVDAGVPVAVPP